MEFGLIIVGDEILSGKRQDKHFPRIVDMLSARGLALAWVRYVGDDRARLTALLAGTFAGDEVVFCCGGIGATPDDHTRQAAAAALGVALELHPDAARLITERCAEMALEGRGSADMGTPENRQRLKMGEFPSGSRIVPNPFNRIPGFAIGNHVFVPGFPVMAHPMIEAVLDGELAHLHHAEPRAERSFRVFEMPESLATPVMEAVEAEFPEVRVFSLPSVGEGGQRRHIELGVKGPAGRIDAAFQRLESGIRALGGEIG